MYNGCNTRTTVLPNCKFPPLESGELPLLKYGKVYYSYDSYHHKIKHKKIKIKNLDVMLMDHIELSTVPSSALVIGGENIQHDL